MFWGNRQKKVEQIMKRRCEEKGGGGYGAKGHISFSSCKKGTLAGLVRRLLSVESREISEEHCETH